MWYITSSREYCTKSISAFRSFHFSKIPFYHAEEATQAIKPLLGNKYLTDATPIWQALWQTFLNLSYVQAQDEDSKVLVWVARDQQDKEPGR